MKKIVTTSIVALTVASSLMAGVPGSCKSCHGANGEKNTILKTKGIPNKLSKADILTALKGYRAGTRNTYGKAMMMGAARGLSDAQQQAVADAWGK